MNTSLPRCPQRGSGQNRWTFLAALWCRRHGLSPEAAFSVLCAEMKTAGHVNLADIQRSIEKVYGCSAPPAPTNRNRFCPIHFTARDQDFATLTELGSCGAKPVNATAFIKSVLDDSNFVCFGRNPRQTRTLPTHEISEGLLDGATVMVPNPLLAPYGINQQGHLSSRCSSMVKCRRYQIIEYDNFSFNEQACRILHISREFKLPPVAVVFSGRASLHAWFFVQHLTASDQACFVDYAVDATGADPAYRSPVQMTRLPFAIRQDTGRVQDLVFFNSNFPA